MCNKAVIVFVYSEDSEEGYRLATLSKAESKKERAKQLYMRAVCLPLFSREREKLHSKRDQKTPRGS